MLTAARLLCGFFVERGREVVSGQLHGMAQRGGSVQASVLVDCGPSPVIPTGGADFVLGLEPVETARALPMMSSRTAVYMNTAPIVPYILGQRAALGQDDADYPDVGRLSESIISVTPHVLALDATRLATEAGSPKALNILMLGCLFGSGSAPGSADEFWLTVAKRLPPRLTEINNKAFLSGVAWGEAACRRGVRA